MKEEQEVSKYHAKLLKKDLEYPVLADWTDAAIFQYLKENVMSVPGTTPHGAHFFTAQSSVFTAVSLPSKYRLPLLWINKWLWQSLYLILTSQKNWETQKLHLLHISRLCSRLLEAGKKTKVDKKWRCPVFDRVLVRFWDHHFCCDPKSVEEYEQKAGKEARDDVLRRNWKSWVAVGCNGFRLVADEIVNGIKASEFTNGLKQAGGTWTWTANTRYSATNPKLIPVKPPSLTISIPSPKRISKPGAAEKVSKAEEPPASCVPPKVAARAKFQRSNSSTPLSQIAASQAPAISTTPAAAAPAPPLVSAPLAVPAAVAYSRPQAAQDPTLTTATNNFLLEAMQAQLTGLFTLVESLRAEQKQHNEDRVNLLREYSETQLELHALKRRLDDSGSQGVMKKRRTEEETSELATPGHSSYHPLSHLIDTEELSSQMDTS